MKIATVILAGGRSSRMGGSDKALLEIGGRPLMACVIERLAPQCAHVAINANGDPERYQRFRLPIIADVAEGFAGPLAGVQSGLRWARKQGVDGIITVAADTPFFPSDLVERLQRGAHGDNIAVASSDGRWHPTFALWPASISGDLNAYLDAGGRKVTSFIERHSHAPVDFGATTLPGGEVDPFFNINTPDDLAEALRLVTPSGA